MATRSTKRSFYTGDQQDKGDDADPAPSILNQDNIDPRESATKETMSQRNILVPKSRRNHPRSKPGNNSAIDAALGNPFGGPGSNPFAQSAPQQPNGANSFGNASSSSTFSSSQSFPPTANGQAKDTTGPTATSFPPASTNGFGASSNGNAFTGFGGGSQTGNNFTFGSNMSNAPNPFAKDKPTPPSQPNSPASGFGFSSGFGGFGAQNTQPTNGPSQPTQFGTSTNLFAQPSPQPQTSAASSSNAFGSSNTVFGSQTSSSNIFGNNTATGAQSSNLFSASGSAGTQPPEPKTPEAKKPKFNFGTVSAHNQADQQQGTQRTSLGGAADTEMLSPPNAISPDNQANGQSQQQQMQQQSPLQQRFGEGLNQQAKEASTPAQTPQQSANQSSNLFAGLSSQTTASKDATKSLFQPSTAQSPQAPAASASSIFAQPTATASKDAAPSNLFANVSNTPKPSLFQPASTPTGLSASKTPVASNSDAMGTSASNAASSNIFNPKTPKQSDLTATANQNIFASSSNIFGAGQNGSSQANASPAVNTPSARPPPATPAAPATVQKASQVVSPETVEVLTALNSSFRDMLNRQDARTDWRCLMQAYAERYESILKGVRPPLKRKASDSLDPAPNRTPQPPFFSKPSESAVSKPSSATSSAIQDILQNTPQKPAASGSPAVPNSVFHATPSVFSAQTSSTPTSSLFKPLTQTTDSSAQDQTQTAPATFSPAPPTFNVGAVNFASQFAAQAQKNAEKEAQEAKAKRRAEDFDSDEDDEAEWEKKDAEQQAAKKAEFEEQMRKAQQAESVFKPSTTPAAIFTPSKTDSSNWANAFANQAKNNLEKEKAKRKAEEFDSDEDDEAEWERKDAQVQAAKKAKLDEAARSAPAFKFDASKASANSNKTSSVFGANAGTSNGNSGSVFSGGFKQPAPTSAGNIFGHLSSSQAPVEDDDDSDDNAQGDGETRADPPSITGSQRSLFYDDESRDNSVEAAEATRGITPSSQNNKTFGGLDGTSDHVPTSDKNSTGGLAKSIFGQSATPAGDQTWKLGSPIKFDGSKTAPPQFKYTSASPTKESATKETDAEPKPSSGLFGSFSKPSGDKSTSLFGSQTSVSTFGSPAKFTGLGSTNSGKSDNLAPPQPSLFGSVSRQSTPGTDITSGNESGAETGDEGPAPDSQVELSDLTEEELREDEMFYEVPSPAKLLKYVDEVGKDGSTKKTWQPQGSGPLRILRNKKTQNLRMMLRASPSGRVILNTRLHPSAKYEKPGAKMVRFTAFEKDGTMSTCIVRTATDDEAVKLRDMLDKNKMN